MEGKLGKNIKKICLFPNLEILCQKRSAQVGMKMKAGRIDSILLHMMLVSHQTEFPTSFVYLIPIIEVFLNPCFR